MEPTQPSGSLMASSESSTMTRQSNRTPILMAVGNHDSRTDLQRAFSTSPAVNQRISGRYVLVPGYTVGIRQ